MVQSLLEILGEGPLPKLTHHEWAKQWFKHKEQAANKQMQQEEQAMVQALDRRDQEDLQRAAAKAKPYQEQRRTAS
jgi:hypothetical protein